MAAGPRVTESQWQRDLQVGRLSLIHDEPHQDVKLLVEWKRLPERKKGVFRVDYGHRPKSFKTFNFAANIVSKKKKGILGSNFLKCFIFIFDATN